MGELLLEASTDDVRARDFFNTDELSMVILEDAPRKDIVPAAAEFQEAVATILGAASPLCKNHIGKKKIHGETAWIYKVDGGGLETWPEEEDGRRGRGDREAQVDQEGFITGWINFVYLAAPSPLEQLLAPHLSTDADDWSLL